MRQVAIIGNGPSKVYAPYDDPAWEIWTLPWLSFPRADKLFEIHHISQWPEKVPYEEALDEDYIERLKKWQHILLLRDPHADLPAATLFPLQDMIKMVRLDYRGSSFCYMIGKAIMEKVDRIGCFGMDLEDSLEYVQQRPNAEFMLGFAIARGIGVHVAPTSPLLKHAFAYGDP